MRVHEAFCMEFHRSFLMQVLPLASDMYSGTVGPPYTSLSSTLETVHIGLPMHKYQGLLNTIIQCAYGFVCRK